MCKFDQFWWESDGNLLESNRFGFLSPWCLGCLSSSCLQGRKQLSTLRCLDQSLASLQRWKVMPCPCWPYLATGRVENVEMEFEKCWSSICLQTSCHLFIEALLLRSCCIVNLVSQFQSHAMFAILAENKRMLSNVATCGVMRDSLCLDFNSSESPLRKTPHPAEADDRNSLRSFHSLHIRKVERWWNMLRPKVRTEVTRLLWRCCGPHWSPQLLQSPELKSLERHPAMCNLQSDSVAVGLSKLLWTNAVTCFSALLLRPEPPSQRQAVCLRSFL